MTGYLKKINYRQLGSLEHNAGRRVTVSSQYNTSPVHTARVAQSKSGQKGLQELLPSSTGRYYNSKYRNCREHQLLF